ncbi:DUF3903 domain-containing protein [Bacillus sp. OTU530]|uniref:DUF3903 domain-containing protein n=1 Tax=Bacillus sp. OTU530 TaxID=3043862 RepID=UPI00313E560D
MISPYHVEYTMAIGNRVVGECITVYASSEFFAIDKVKQELHRRFGSATSIELNSSSSVDNAPEPIIMGI